MENANT